MTTIPHIQYLLQDFFVIPAVCHDLAADQFHAPAEAETAFCCLISGADFSVIEHVFLSHRNRRKIRHHDICAGFYAEFTSLRTDRSQCCSCRKEHIRKHQTKECQIKKRVFKCSALFIMERSILMCNERSDPDHLRIQFFEEQEILYQIIDGLVRRTHHKACTCLIAQFFEGAKTVFAVFAGHFFWMEFAVMLFTRGLMPQKIAVCTGFFVGTVAFFGFLPDGKCQGTVRINFFDLTDQSCQLLICIISVFSSLKDKSTESQFIAFFAAGKDIFFCQAVTLGISVAPADSTVIAVIFAVVGKLDQSTYIDLVSIDLLPHLVCQFPCIQICFF